MKETTKCHSLRLEDGTYGSYLKGRGLTELKVKFPVEFEKFESYCENILK
jgi:hypothetical protein